MSTLLSERLQLRPHSMKTDTQKIVNWLNDRDLMKYSEQRHRVHTINSEISYIESFQWPSLFRCIYSGERLIGTITAYVDHNNSIADMGILIGERGEQGRGYGTESWRVMLSHLLDCGIRKVEAGCMAANEGMKKIFVNSGMHKEAERRNHFLLNGEPVNMELWALFGR